MKIVMLISSFYPLMGGAEVQARRLGKQLVEKGHSVTVLTRWHHDLKKNENIDGINVIRIPVSNINKIKPILYLYKVLFFAWKNRKKIDIIHAHSLSSPGFTASLISFLLRIPSISKIAGGGNKIGCEAKRMFMAGGFKRLRIRFMNKYLSKYIAISKAIYDDLRDIGVPQNKIIFLPNGINTTHISNNEIPRELYKIKIIQEKNIFLYAGRFEKIKGIDVLLEAWSRTTDDFRRTNQLVLLGNGSFNVEKYLADNSISFIGKVSNVDDFMSYSDYFILPSRYEGISNALLEAITNRLFIIATPVGGNRDIVSHNETGYIFENENIEQLKIVLERVVNLSEEKKNIIKRNAYNLIRSRYDFNNITSQYLKLYTNLLKKVQ